MPDIPKLVQSIESGKYDDKQLVNLYRNTEKYDSITEEDRELVMEAVETELRKTYPRKAKAKFGPVDARPREVLEELYASVSNRFDLSKNTLKNGVKTGGAMISGDGYIDLYISYKAKNKNGVVAHAYQSKQTDPLKYHVFKYTGSAKPENRTGLVEYDAESPEIEKYFAQALTELLDT